MKYIVMDYSDGDYFTEEFENKGVNRNTERRFTCWKASIQMKTRPITTTETL